MSLNICLETRNGISEHLSNMLDTHNMSVSDFRDFLEETPVKELEKNWHKVGGYRRIVAVKTTGNRVRLTLVDGFGNTSYLSYDNPQPETTGSKSVYSKLSYVRDQIVDILENGDGNTPVSKLLKLIEYIDS